MLNTSRIAVNWLFGVALIAATMPVAAQEYPSRRISVVVANTPGTTVDLVSRLVAPEMSRLLGQAIIVENRPGADSVIGFEYVARQMPADGYTIAAVSVSSLAALPASVKDLRFNPLTDLPPVIVLGTGRYVVGTASKESWKTINELVAYAKERPGKLNYGSFGSVVLLLAAALVRDLGLDMVHVPYKGGTPFLQSLVGGEVHLGFMNEAAAIGLGDRLRVLAVTGEKRRAPFADVPTFAELGFAHFQGASHSFNVRVGTPKVAIDKLYDAAAKALDTPDVKARFAKLQLEVSSDTPEIAARKLAAEARLFLDIAKGL